MPEDKSISTLYVGLMGQQVVLVQEHHVIIINSVILLLLRALYYPLCEAHGPAGVSCIPCVWTHMRRRIHACHMRRRMYSMCVDVQTKPLHPYALVGVSCFFLRACRHVCVCVCARARARRACLSIFGHPLPDCQ